MSLAKKLSTALNETRLLILGGQVLFGFEFHGVFQEGFAALPWHSRYLHCVSLVSMMIAIGLLIAPSVQHRIVERGEETRRILRTASLLAGLALLPFGVSLGIDMFVGMEAIVGIRPALLSAAAIFILAGLLWYALGFAIRERRGVEPMEQEEEKPTPLSTKIDQMLTEARVVLPGAQALLGFQLTVVLSHAFQQLPYGAKLLHAMALCCVALAIVLLMTPAALHRIGFKGEETKSFLSMGSLFVMLAPLPLAIGAAADIYVAVEKAAESQALGYAAGIAAICLLLFLWYLQPFLIRMRLRHAKPA
ncbi:MAG TPA: DUF6328 family protein [Xanthobacteraceae bacterium]